MVPNLFHDSFSNQLTLVVLHKLLDASLGRGALVRIAAKPQLDFAGDDFLSVGGALLPVAEHSCFQQTISYPPDPNVTQPLEHTLPPPEPPR